MLIIFALILILGIGFVVGDDNVTDHETSESSMKIMKDKDIELLPIPEQLKIYKWKARYFEAQSKNFELKAKKFEFKMNECKNFVDEHLTKTFYRLNAYGITTRRL